MTPVRRFVPIHFLITILAAAALLLAACTPAATQEAALATLVPVTGDDNLAPTATLAGSIPESITPAVRVSDQSVANGEVLVDQVDSAGPGWLVIHINDAGAPGPIIGWAPVKAGVNSNVAVTIDASKATSVLYAMLHVDAGQVGTYEFPGPDAPVTFNGLMVNPAFAATGAGGSDSGGDTPDAAATAAPAATNTTAASGAYSDPAATAAPTAAAGGEAAARPATINIVENSQLGQILVDREGLTLYIFKKDTPGTSTCTGGCLENWPPLLAAGPIQAGPGINGQLGVITRPDDGQQVTYNNLPLYYFAGDQAPGDVNGQGIGDVWFAATP